MKIGEILNPSKVGERGFDPKELFNSIRNHRIVWCWGAHAWTAHEDKFLRFKSEGYLHKGHVYITLGWDDTFTIIYTTLKGRVLDIQEGIYIDMLIDSIDRKIETK
jgi:hypothetical protein